MLVIIFLVGFYFELRPNHNGIKEPSNPPKIDDQAKINEKNKVNTYSRPKNGISTYIGKSTKELTKQFGKPSRIDASAYGYDWWIYKKKDATYFQAGVKNGKVVTIYALGSGLSVSPFKIGEKVETIYQTITMNTNITVKMKDGTYRFELSEEDLNISPLVQLGDIYAQLALDKFSGTLTSVRFMDKRTLVQQHPYAMSYQGHLAKETIDSTKREEVERGSEQQIFDMTNIIRQRYKAPKLHWDKELSIFAYDHSKDMAVDNYFSHTSPRYGNLSKRLKTANIVYQSAGENIAANYIDGPATVEGWLNSEEHRKAMLDSQFTSLGVGVYDKYYTQDFAQR